MKCKAQFVRNIFRKPYLAVKCGLMWLLVCRQTLKLETKGNRTTAAATTTTTTTTTTILLFGTTVGRINNTVFPHTWHPDQDSPPITNPVPCQYIAVWHTSWHEELSWHSWTSSKWLLLGNTAMCSVANRNLTGAERTLITKPHDWWRHSDSNCPHEQ
jgi:hypothetical protein